MENTEVGYILAGITTLAWGLAVIPVKMSKSPGSKGIAFSIPAGILILLPFLIYTLYYNLSSINIASLDVLSFFIIAGGICQFPLATICYYEAIRNADISTVTPLQCLKMPMVIGIVLVLGIETVSLHSIIGCLIGIVGAVVITGKKKKNSHPQNTEATLHIKKGIILVLLACLFWSMGDLLLREAIQGLPSTVVTPVALFVGGLGFYIWTFIKGNAREVFGIPLRDKICYNIHGVVSFGIGYCTFLAAMSYIGVSRTVIITNSWPLISFLVGIFIYREKISVTKTVGAFLLISSIYYVIIT